MLDIYQGFFENIGPLKNKKLNINYKKGKVMIKAPIGTGKSFFFFDAPIYGLYKSSSRTIINKDSKSALIQLLFSVNENFYLVERKLTQTKSGKDSSKTFLYELEKNKELIDYLNDFIDKKNIVNLNGNDILTNLKFYQIKIKNLTSEFKQEKEIQQALDDILPSKEVALSTIFLTQESENIFEKSPSDRIEIFKKVFGILGIDEAKEKIDEKKRELANLIKAKQEDSIYNEKLKEILDNFKLFKGYDYRYLSEILDKINKSLYGDDLFNGIFENLDLNLDLDKISLIDIDFSFFLNEIKNEQEKLLRENENYNSIIKQIDGLNNDKTKLIKEIENIKKEILSLNDLEKKIDLLKLDLKGEKLKLEKLQEKKSRIEKIYDSIQQSYEDYLKLNNTYSSLRKEKINLEQEISNLQKEKLNLEKKVKLLKEKIISVSNERIKDIENKMKDIENVDFKIYSFDGNTPSSISELDDLIKEIHLKGLNLKENIEKQKKSILEYENEILQLNNQIKRNKKINFNCDKIGEECPFIEKISSLLLNDNFILEQIKQKEKKLKIYRDDLIKLEKQREYLVNYWKKNEISLLKKNIQFYFDLEKEYSKLLKKQQEVSENEKDISNIYGQISSIDLQISNNKKKLENLTNDILALKFKIVDNKVIEDDYKLYSSILNNIQEQLDKINVINSEIEKFKDKEENIKILEGSLKDKENILEQIDFKILELEKEKNKIFLEIDKKSLNDLKKEEELVLKLKENVIQLNSLIQDYKKNKLSILELKNKFNLYKDLSNIFGREILMYVFMDHIGNLENLINYFIKDIVNFTLNIKLDDKGENLDIYVEDERGKREVKSLSGGQKTALRIGWILAINRLQNSRFLFLDETINNFDQESIHKISQKIKDFVEKNDLKFYMVTHSDVLQQLNIWDNTVELNLDLLKN